MQVMTKANKANKYYKNVITEVSKRKLLRESIESMTEEANKLAVEAETKHSFTLLAKSNAFRKKVQESEENEK